MRSAVTAARLLGLFVLWLLGLLLLLVFVECPLFYIIVIVLLLVLHPANSQGPVQEKNSGDTGKYEALGKTNLHYLLFKFHSAIDCTSTRGLVSCELVKI